jgi:hypothetical protein
LREEHWLRVFENRVLRRIPQSTRKEVKAAEGDCEVGSLMISTVHQILFG